MVNMDYISSVNTQNKYTNVSSLQSREKIKKIRILKAMFGFLFHCACPESGFPRLLS